MDKAAESLTRLGAALDYEAGGRARLGLPGFDTVERPRAVSRKTAQFMR